MSDINSSTVCGRLVRDPEVRRNSHVWATFSVASNSRYKERDETAFVPCVVFGPAAEWCKDHHKGEHVIVSGRLRTSTWETDGKRQSRLELVVDQVQFLQRPTNNGFANGGAKREEEPISDEVKKAVPF